MSSSMYHSAVLVFTMALVTALLRFLPFLVFRQNTPAYIVYLGKVLPPAIIGMLVIYCLREVNVTSFPFGLPEFTAAFCVAVLQVWKRNSLLSILLGTVIYMLLIQFIF